MEYQVPKSPFPSSVKHKDFNAGFHSCKKSISRGEEKQIPKTWTINPQPNTKPTKTLFRCPQLISLVFLLCYFGSSTQIRKYIFKFCKSNHKSFFTLLSSQLYELLELAVFRKKKVILQKHLSFYLKAYYLYFALLWRAWST